jgi:UPF0716 protein FxsA
VDSLESSNYAVSTMRFLIGLILLAFPVLEIILLVQLAHHYGWWVLFYLVVIGFLGLQLIRGEKLLISAKMMHSVTSGGNPIKTLLGSARNMVAGILLMIPGVMTDIIAVILLLIPISKQKLSSATNHQHQQTRYEKAANDDVIEGEYTHVSEEKDKLK